MDCKKQSVNWIHSTEERNNRREIMNSEIHFGLHEKRETD
jgi:hypothetical protein